MVIFRGKGRRNDTPENSHEYLKSHTLVNAQDIHYASLCHIDAMHITNMFQRWFYG